MAYKRSRNHSVAVGFTAILTLWVAFAALAPIPTQGQQPVQPTVRRRLLPRAPNTGATSRSLPRKTSAHPLDETPPLSPFLPAVLYRLAGLFGTNGSASIAVADVNGDGKFDIVLANPEVLGYPELCGGWQGTVSLQAGNGDGTFGAPWAQCSTGRWAWGIAIADVNGDGKPELITTNVYSSYVDSDSSVVVMQMEPNGYFNVIEAYSTGGQVATSVAVADVNGDGHPDLIVANGCALSDDCYSETADANIAVLLGNGDGTFRPAATYDSGGSYTGNVAVADVNGDGKPDVIVLNSASVAVLLGKGDGTFASPITYSSAGTNPDSVAVADVNGDGKPDLIVANGCGTCDSAVAVLLGNGDGTFKPAVTYSAGGRGGASVALADVNGDGKSDLIVADGNGSVSVLLANGDGTFQTATTFDLGTFESPMVAVDLNGDGLPDLVAVLADAPGGVSVSLHVGVTPTTIAVSSSPNPSDFGQPVTLTATVSSSSGTPSGDVEFFEHSTLIGTATLVSGTGSASISGLTAGTHSITAIYQGSVTFKPSASTSIAQIVHAAPTTVSVWPSLNPILINRPVRYLAYLNTEYWGAALTGTVTFDDGATPIATVGLSGKYATYTLSYSTVGNHSITATYSGDANNVGSTSGILVEQVHGFSSKTALATSASPSFVGQPVTFTAAVTSLHGTIPDGDLVKFYDGTSAIGEGGTTNGVATFTTSSLTAKPHRITASYLGDATFAPSYGTLDQTVNSYTTTTTLVSGMNPSTYGLAVTWTAKVTSTAPNQATGKVRFLGVGSAPLTAGVATLTHQWLNAGTHSITAEYEGDSYSASSSSSALSQVVNPASTTTEIASSVNPSSSGQTVTFTATVKSATGAHPTGTVTFTAGSMTLGTVKLSNTPASVSTASLPVGSTPITATYNGTVDFAGSSATLTQVVQP